MIRFDAAPTGRFLVVNWEDRIDDPKDCLELTISPISVAMSVQENGVATWREEDYDSVSSVCVNVGSFRAVLLAFRQEQLVAATLPVVTGCESQLTVEATGVSNEIRLVIKGLYPPQLSMTIEVSVSKMLQRLFPTE